MPGTWDNTKPDGTETASTIDNIIKDLKIDIEDRMQNVGNHKTVNNTSDYWKHVGYGGSFDIYDITGNTVIFTVVDNASGGDGSGFSGFKMPFCYNMHIAGQLTIGAQSVSIYVPFAHTITAVYADAGTPGGGSPNIELHTGATYGATGTARASCAVPGSDTSISLAGVTATDQFYTIKVTNIGSPTVADLTVTVVGYRYVTGV